MNPRQTTAEMGSAVGQATTPWLQQAASKFRTNLGSVGKNTAAPGVFQDIGGPLTGTLLQSALLGGVGYLGGRLWKGDDEESKAPLYGTLGGIGLGLGLNAKDLAYNLQAMPNVQGWQNRLKMMNMSSPEWETGGGRDWYFKNIPDVRRRAAMELAKIMQTENTDVPVESRNYSYPVNYLAKQMLNEYPQWFPKNGSYKKAVLDAETYGQAGELINYDTFLPPGRTSMGFPARYTIQQIDSDPYMSPIAKAKTIALINESSNGGGGLLSWGDVARAGVGAGIGYASAKIFGKVLDGVFGGLAPKTHERLQQAGVIAGLLKGTGVVR
jgi:hypothetical protein